MPIMIMVPLKVIYDIHIKRDRHIVVGDGASAILMNVINGYSIMKIGRSIMEPCCVISLPKELKSPRWPHFFSTKMINCLLPWSKITTNEKNTNQSRLLNAKK